MCFKKKPKQYLDYKKAILDLIKDCYAILPTNYDFTSDAAYAILNQHTSEVNKAYGQIVFYLNSVFEVNDDKFADWSKNFNDYVISNKNILVKMKHSIGYNGAYLTDQSKEIFCLYADGINRRINELSRLCSNVFNKSKRNPTENTVFIVHGHDHSLKNTLRKALKNKGYCPIVLSDMNDSGISLFDKFEKYANRCSKAIILMTKDDLIEKNGIKYFQARPNVLVEFGYFLNMLDRKNIVVLLEKGCEKPSDIDGVAYIEYDNKFRKVVSKVLDSLTIS